MKWKTVNFEDGVNSRGSGAAGLAQSQWEEGGQYPVIGQGAEFIEGWTNRADLLLTPNPAVVLYGGHTRRAKFVDTPFVPGPNVKILEPKETLDAKFLFYFLAQLPIESRGYADHFPQVRRSSIPVPPLAEQRRIAEALDRAEALRAKRRAALAQLDTLTQSLFLDLFGDPISNPLKWPQENLETFFHFRTGKLDSNAAVASGQYPFFTCSRDDFRIDTFAFDCEALLLAGNNASADYSVKYYKGKFNAYQRTYVITLRDERNSYDYARFVLEHRLGELKRMSKGTGTKYLTMELLNRIRVPVPPITLQREFARRETVVEALRTAQRAALAELDALFATLQHRAFKGEL